MSASSDYLLLMDCNSEEFVPVVSRTSMGGKKFSKVKSKQKRKQSMLLQ